MKTGVRCGLRFALAFAIFLIAGCASNMRATASNDANTPHWQGRLALKIQSTPAQAFSADFDLHGSAQAGGLAFFTPLGSTIARLQWNADAAVLQTNGEPQHFESLVALTRYTTGTDLPIASLFSWLQGTDLPTPGWEADLSSLPSGRLSARRLGPDAPAELKIILER
ncbi:MAG: hypothetical protein A3F78_13070 [Burkholderiales bacterium RIFCSPLOWO2_12_FULL_61_40]|nr:MAG: hypothetical protein A3F78_13070 [Burkholderiales bacterium RIFCSPLOWO2_12_FULL_61_40]